MLKGASAAQSGSRQSDKQKQQHRRKAQTLLVLAERLVPKTPESGTAPLFVVAASHYVWRMQLQTENHRGKPIPSGARLAPRCMDGFRR